MNPLISIITPALADANNGNWQTASRWARFLRSAGYRTTMSLAWDETPADLMIALHARRSADSIARFAARGGSVVLVLTGTDLYRDIHQDPVAQRSLDLARRLVVLQPQGRRSLPKALQARTSVIYQSAPRLAALAPRTRTFDLVMVGHARAEKDPLTALRAMQDDRLNTTARPTLRLVHIGGDREPALYRQMVDLARDDPRIELLGALPHGATRRQIRRARALVLPSLMEGGANVLIEAVTSGVPVLASRIDGSIGMLGADYEGYFEVGDHAALAGLIARFQDQPAYRERLMAQCRRRAPLFAPTQEREAVLALIAGQFGAAPRSPQAGRATSSANQS